MKSCGFDRSVLTVSLAAASLLNQINNYSNQKLYHAPLERPKKVKWEIGLIALAVIAAGGVRAICLRVTPNFSSASACLDGGQHPRRKLSDWLG